LTRRDAASENWAKKLKSDCGVKISSPWIDLANRIKKTDAAKLQDEYAKLVEGLQEAENDGDAFMANPRQ
jgi:hypothetical protein